jgi:hypothetical protein
MFDPDADLTELAQDCGYFDQAHFIKDFKAFTGKTPTEYARQMRAMQEILKERCRVLTISERIARMKMALRRFRYEAIVVIERIR